MQRLFGISFALVFFGITGSFADAATLYIDPNTAELHPGDTIAMAVRIDTDEGECINVIDGVLTYDKGVIPVDISRGNSILPIWVEDPVIDTSNNRITFAGGIPNGYCGRIAGDPKLTNILLEIIFQAPGLQIGFGDIDPLVKIDFAPMTTVFLNDGLGTAAPLLTLGAEIFVHKKPGNEVVDQWNSRIVADSDSPRQFSVTLVTDKSIYNGSYFVTFNTTDKQTGLDHYEIIEEPLDEFDLFGWGRTDAPWIEARSPYLLKDQTLNSTIRVKAIDKAGNEYIAVYTPDESMRGVSTRKYVEAGLYVAGATILIILIGSILFYHYRRRAIVEVPDHEVE